MSVYRRTIGSVVAVERNIGWKAIARALKQNASNSHASLDGVCGDAHRLEGPEVCGVGRWIPSASPTGNLRTIQLRERGVFPSVTIDVSHANTRQKQPITAPYRRCLPSGCHFCKGIPPPIRTSNSGPTSAREESSSVPAAIVVSKHRGGVGPPDTIQRRDLQLPLELERAALGRSVALHAGIPRSQRVLDVQLCGDCRKQDLIKRAGKGNPRSG
jgi:hypothetical protein